MSNNTTKNGDAFDRWRAEVDAEVSRRVGIGLDDLPDCPTANWFDEGLTPKQAARAAIANASDELE
jgi:hypothetical protein